MTDEEADKPMRECFQAGKRAGYRAAMEAARGKCAELIANHKSYPYIGHLKRWDKFHKWLDEQAKKEGA